ncbi:MAG: hypothetical protein V2I67_11955 [Thermoanaerobaculales bacterium]|jgi:hypothetical protein|nr:hypothetical protein [Thermoanaerobaculales bacterium]
MNTDPSQKEVPAEKAQVSDLRHLLIGTTFQQLVLVSPCRSTGRRAFGAPTPPTICMPAFPPFYKEKMGTGTSCVFRGVLLHRLVIEISPGVPKARPSVEWESIDKHW